MSTERKATPNLSEAWQEALTARIINDLKEGVPSWVKPWRDNKNAATVGMPRNAITGRAYSGANVLQLWALAMENGYRSHQWATYQQAQQVGARVRKGAKSTQVIYVNFVEKEDKENPGKTKKQPFLKVFCVFNLEQLENLPVDYLRPAPMLPPSEYALECVRFAHDTGIRLIQFGSDRAAYYPAGDAISMPHHDQFTDTGAFAGTLCHELTHASGHKDRLARQYGSRFGDATYAFEELVAELGSAFLCADLGIPPSTRTNAAYIASWIKVLENDHKAIVSAASYASQAFAYMTDQAEKAKTARIAAE